MGAAPALADDHHAFHEDARPGDLGLQLGIRWRSSSNQFTRTRNRLSGLALEQHAMALRLICAAAELVELHQIAPRVLPILLESAARRQFGLNAPEADKLLELAEEERRQAVDLWQFTNLIAESYSIGQKMVLAEVMWGVVYADGDLASKEDYLMRKISNLLRLEPGYLAEARKRVEEGSEGDTASAGGPT